MNKSIKIAALMAQMNVDIIAMVKDNKTIIDGHNGGKRTMELTHVGRFIRGEKEYIVPMINRPTVFCLNPLEIINGKVVLSTYSVGGTIDLTHGISLEQGVKSFNKDSDKWDFGQITELIAL